MALEKLKINTKITSIEDAVKALQDVEKSFNKLVDKINSPAEKQLKETEGSSGDIQVTRNRDKSYTFEVRTEDGWKTPVIGGSAIKFANKPSTFSIEQKKSIEDIETDDTSTGDVKAKNTIYDEKNKEFSVKHLMTPDYDSDWWNPAAEDTSITVGAHGLDIDPNDANLWYLIFARDAVLGGTPTRWKLIGGDGGMTVDENDSWDVGYDATNFYQHTDVDQGDTRLYWGTGGVTTWGNASYRIKAWIIR